MSMNNNNSAKNTAGISAHNLFGNMQQPQYQQQQQPHFQQHQPPGGVTRFPGHFQLSEPQAQALAQAQYTQHHAQAAKAAHAQFQAQLQAQAQSLAAQLQGGGGVSQNVNNAANLGAGGGGGGGTGGGQNSGSTPGSGSGKRSHHRPPSKGQGSSNVNSGTPYKTMELTPAVRRKKRKINEKQIPDKVAAIVPESALYTQLLEFEARIDSALMRKKIDIQDAVKSPPCVQKTLRIYVFNTFANQTQVTVDKKNAEPPSWSLKIVGRILEDGGDPVVTGNLNKSSSSSPKFSSFFKKITIYLDQNIYPDNHVILWESARSPVLHEGFEVKRKGDKEFTALMRLEMNNVPERYKLSPALIEVLGIDMETRPRIICALWHYIKAKKLQSQNDPSFFMCDPPLQKLFGEEKMKFSMISSKLSQHLSSPQPIHLEHKIKLSGNSPASTACYDVLVDVPFPVLKEMAAYLENTERQKEIDACDELISSAIKKIHEHRRRRAFFLGFSQSPAEFIDTLIASQDRDLKLAAGDATRTAEKEQRSDFYNQLWVEDAVIRYLNRRAAASDGPGNN